MDTSRKNEPGHAHSRTFIGRSVHLLYKTLVEPRAADAKTRRHESILNTILVSVILIGIVLDASVVYDSAVLGAAYHGIGLLTFSLIILFFACLLVLSRVGFIRSASYVLIFGYIAAITYAEFRWGVDLPAGLLSYALIITISTILIGGRFGIIISVFISSIILLLAYHESIFNIVPLWKKEPVIFANSIQYSFILLSITLLSRLYWREIEKSMRRAEDSEQALRQKNESLEEIVEERTRELKRVQVEKMSQLYRFVEFGRLSSGIFHDLMNPLSAMALQIAELESSISSEAPELRKTLAEALAASKRIERFVDSARNQIKIQDISVPFSVNEEIEDVIMLFEYRAMKEKIDLEFSAFRKIITVGNPIKFHQVIANLLSNAFDAYERNEKIPAGTPVGTIVSRSIRMYVQKKGSSIEIKVRDHGCGIPAEIVGTIFEPFFTTKKEKGIGLGLSTTRLIIEKDFGGTIRAVSTPGEGSSFIINIPQKPHETIPEKSAGKPTVRRDISSEISGVSNAS